MAKTDFVYLTELPVTEPLSVLQAALAYFEEMEYFKALSVTYLADHVSGFYSVRFTVAGETLLLEELTLDTDDFEELGAAYTAK